MDTCDAGPAWEGDLGDSTLTVTSDGETVHLTGCEFVGTAARCWAGPGAMMRLKSIYERRMPVTVVSKEFSSANAILTALSVGGSRDSSELWEIGLKFKEIRVAPPRSKAALSERAALSIEQCHPWLGEKLAVMRDATRPVHDRIYAAEWILTHGFEEVGTPTAPDLREEIKAAACGENLPARHTRPDPIDVEIDGWKVHKLLEVDEEARRGIHYGRSWTTAQRAAVSAHWSAELRARIAGGESADAAAFHETCDRDRRERERRRVVLDCTEEL